MKEQTEEKPKVPYENPETSKFLRTYLSGLYPTKQEVPDMRGVEGVRLERLLKKNDFTILGEPHGETPNVILALNHREPWSFKYTDENVEASHRQMSGAIMDAAPFIDAVHAEKGGGSFKGFVSHAKLGEVIEIERFYLQRPFLKDGLSKEVLQALTYGGKPVVFNSHINERINERLCDAVDVMTESTRTGNGNPGERLESNYDRAQEYAARKVLGELNKGKKIMQIGKLNYFTHTLDDELRKTSFVQRIKDAGYGIVVIAPIVPIKS